MFKIENEEITKDNKVKQERYLYSKILTTTSVLTALAEKLLEIKAPDMLETYRKQGTINGLSAMYIIELMLEGLEEEEGQD